MNRKVSLIVFLIILLGAFQFPVRVVKASGTYEITDTLMYKATYDRYQNFDNNLVTLSDGKCVVTYIPDLATDNVIRLKVFNSDGTLYGSVDYTFSPSTKVPICVGLKYVSDTVVYVYCAYTYVGGGSTDWTGFGVLKFNPIAVSYNTMIVNTGIDHSGSSRPDLYGFITDMLLYNSKYYFMVSHEIYGGGASLRWSRIELLEYTVDTTLGFTNIAVGTTGSGNRASPIYWFQSPTDTQYAYVAYDYIATATLSYYTINLSAKTSTLIAGVWDTAYAITTTQAINSHYIKGGLVANGTDNYLYFSWVASTLVGGVPTWNYCNDRMKFNGTVDTAHLVGHMNYVHSITSGSYTGVTDEYWFIGYEVNKSSVYIYFPSNTAGGIVYATRHIMTATDWFNYAGYGWSYDSQYPTTDNIPVQVDKEYPLQFGFTSQFALGASATKIKLYFGLSTAIATYTATVSYTPLDTPNLDQNKQYTFTVTAYKNSIATQYLNIRFLSNAVEQLPTFKATNANGQVTYLVTFTQANIYDLDWEVYDPYSIYPTTLQYTLSETYIVSYVPGTPTGGDPTDIVQESIISQNALVSTFVPAFAIVVGPAVLFLPFGGAGLVIGLGVGALMGVVTGILPFYVIFILILLVAVAIVMTFRSGISGPRGEG